MGSILLIYLYTFKRIITNGITEEKLLEYASYAEAYSSHPIAKSIINTYNRDIDINRVNSVEIAGKGIKAEYEGKNILCGKRELLVENGVTVDFDAKEVYEYIARKTGAIK